MDFEVGDLVFDTLTDGLMIIKSTEPEPLCLSWWWKNDGDVDGYDYESETYCRANANYLILISKKEF